MTKFVPVLMALFIWLSGALPAVAQETPWRSADYLQARLLSGVTQIAEDQQEFRAALDLRLMENWHAYWRMPGDGGLPPQFEWNASENVKSVEIDWPVPERFEIVGLNSFGYEGNVFFPLTVKLDKPGQKARLDLRAEIMVCHDICVPQRVTLALNIPAGSKNEPGQYMPRIEKALDNMAHKDNVPGLKIENAVIGPDAIVVNAFSQGGFEKADLYVESGDLYVTTKPQITVDKDDERKAMMRVAAPPGVDNLASKLMGRTVTLTLVNGRTAVEKTINF